MHTSEVSACAVSTAAEQVRAYKARGYAGIIITDHFINGYSTCPKKLPWDKKMKHIISGYDEAKKAGKKYGLDVFLGWEFTIKGSDFLTYGLGLDFLTAHPGIDRFPIEKYSAVVRENNGFLAQAHPFRDSWYIENKFPAAPHLVDSIEVYNANDSAESNKKALAYAKKHNLPIQAGSDAHGIHNSRYTGIILNNKADSIFDIIQAIKTKKIELF
jgi:hypothetical protein